MNKNLFPNLEQILAQVPRQLASRQEIAQTSRAAVQSFRDYRRSQPARQTTERKAIYLSRIGELSAAQETVVTATAEYLALFFELPVRRGADFDPAAFRPWGVRKHPTRGHAQLLTEYINQEVLAHARPGEALICLAVTAWDLWSDDYSDELWGSAFGEAIYGHAGVWSLRYLGEPSGGQSAFQRCLKRSCAVASHEALHVLGLDHCADVPCNMKGAACLSGPLHLCPPCLRKLCWNRQVDLLPYLARLRDWLAHKEFTDAAEHYECRLRLLDRGKTHNEGPSNS